MHEINVFLLPLSASSQPPTTSLDICASPFQYLSRLHVLLVPLLHCEGESHPSCRQKGNVSERLGGKLGEAME